MSCHALLLVALIYQRIYLIEYIFVFTICV